MREPIEWSSDLETGNPFIDRQHRMMVDSFNDLIAAEDDTACVVQVLEHLDEQTLVHFGTEEKLMTDRGYPRELADKHIKIHHDLKSRVREFVLEFKAGRLTSPSPLIDFLHDWLREHEVHMDRELVAWIREHAGTSAPA